MEIVAFVLGSFVVVLLILGGVKAVRRSRNLAGELLPPEEVLLECKRVAVRAKSLGTGKVLGLRPNYLVRMVGRMQALCARASAARRRADDQRDRSQ